MARAERLREIIEFHLEEARLGLKAPGPGPLPLGPAAGVLVCCGVPRGVRTGR